MKFKVSVSCLKRVTMFLIVNKMWSYGLQRTRCISVSSGKQVVLEAWWQSYYMQPIRQYIVASKLAD